MVIAYQNKGNGECINMQAHILSLYTSSIFEVGSRVKTFFFLKVVMSVKLKGMEHRTPCKHILCSYIHSRPLGWGQNAKTFSSERSHVTCQIKGNGTKSTMQAHILSLHTLLVPGWSQKVKKIFL